MPTAAACLPAADVVVGRRIRVRGRVQGVGFRPTVWRLARACAVTGDVRNDGDGVLLHAWGTPTALDELKRRLAGGEAPPLARIDSIDSTPLRGPDVPTSFTIVASRGGAVRTEGAPDAASCKACLADIDDPGDRRYGYAFTNCTHCGPRLSIVNGIPYDRAHTTMATFRMCDACRAEYDDPTDRRFHAQPVACPACGPLLWLESPEGDRVSGTPEEALDAAVECLLHGGIAAVKGLGGFHLACDALDNAAVDRLRARKHRRDKPLAVMALDLDMIRRFCTVAPTEARLLDSAAAPIVLLPVDGECRLAQAVAPGVATLGFMLPHTPLHHLLLRAVGRPLVMTSGNLSDEPPCTDNEDARQRLSPIADLLLMHDRNIANRIDDSVARVVGGQTRLLRRARGHAPAPVRLPAGFEAAPELLAMGGELKNTFCLVKGGEAIVSQHIGDLESAAAHADYAKSLTLFTALFDHEPKAIVVDLHPEYLSTKLGRERADESGCELIGVQHHHAHVAALLAESGRPLAAAPILGIVLDGLGWGSDNTFWGGEFLLADYAGFSRLARFRPAPMPGGARSVREPWRSAWAHLRALPRESGATAPWHELDIGRLLAAKPCATLETMLAAGINSPRASSCGRLFDAVAATLGVCAERIGYEAQAAIELEALAEQAPRNRAGDGYPFALDPGTSTGTGTGTLPELDATPMWHALFADLASGTPRALAALRFHRGLARALVDVAVTLATSPGGRSFDTVGLTGGVFQNRLLFESISEGLAGAGFAVLSHRLFPCHDGGLALGQATVAAARRLRQPEVTDREELACA